MGWQSQRERMAAQRFLDLAAFQPPDLRYTGPVSLQDLSPSLFDEHARLALDQERGPRARGLPGEPTAHFRRHDADQHPLMPPGAVPVAWWGSSLSAGTDRQRAVADLAGADHTAEPALPVAVVGGRLGLRLREGGGQNDEKSQRYVQDLPHGFTSSRGAGRHWRTAGEVTIAGSPGHGEEPGLACAPSEHLSLWTNLIGFLERRNR